MKIPNTNLTLEIVTQNENAEMPLVDIWISNGEISLPLISIDQYTPNKDDMLDDALHIYTYEEALRDDYTSKIDINIERYAKEMKGYMD